MFRNDEDANDVGQDTWNQTSDEHEKDKYDPQYHWVNIKVFPQSTKYSLPHSIRFAFV